MMKSKKGFTLIELVIVVGVLALLLAMLVPNVLGFLGQSDTVAAEANAKTAYSAALQVSLLDGTRSGTLELGNSATVGSDAEQIRNMLGSGMVIINAAVPTDSTFSTGENIAYIQLDATGVPIAAYYNKVDARYPKATVSE